MRTLLALLLCLIGTAQAQTVGLHTLTHHFDSHDGLNERNVGLYVRTDAWEVGAYRNSYRRTTAYAGKVWSYGPASITLGVDDSRFELRVRMGDKVMGGAVVVEVE